MARGTQYIQIKKHHEHQSKLRRIYEWDLLPAENSSKIIHPGTKCGERWRCHPPRQGKRPTITPFAASPAPTGSLNLFLLKFPSGLKIGAHSSLPLFPNSLWVCDVQVPAAGLVPGGEEKNYSCLDADSIQRELDGCKDFEDVRTSQPISLSPFLWIRKWRPRKVVSLLTISKAPPPKKNRKMKQPLANLRLVPLTVSCISYSTNGWPLDKGTGSTMNRHWSISRWLCSSPDPLLRRTLRHGKRVQIYRMEQWLLSGWKGIPRRCLDSSYPRT